MAENYYLSDLSSSDTMFLSELSGTIEQLANKHIQSEREYFPYDFADAYDQAVANKDIDLTAPEAQIDEASKHALFVNQLTEDGLPEYVSTIQRRLPMEHPLRDWSHLWSADEGRHGPTMSNFMHKTGQFDMRELERARVAMMRHPDTPQPQSVIESLIYPAIQEPATEISHRNVMRRLPKAHKIGKRALGYIIGDEVRHGTFYQETVAAALEIEPSLTIIGIARQVRKFTMPGKAIPNFKNLEKVITDADIFGPKQLVDIYSELFSDKLAIWELDNLSPEAEAARDAISRRIDALGRIAEKQQSTAVQ